MQKPYTHICSQVAEFNYLFGVIDYNYPNIEYIEEDKFNSFSDKFNLTQIKLRFSLINEEVKELEQAVNNKNPIEIIDALCDILYVVAGAKVYFNLPVDVFTECKINDLYDSVGEPSVDEQDLKNIINGLNEDKIKILIKKIKENNEVLENLTKILINENRIFYHIKFLNHLIRIYNKSLDKIVVNIFKLTSYENLDFNMIHQFDIVHNSNMTKVCITENDAKKTVEWYKVNEQRYKEPSYRKINYNDKDYYVIYDAETKKILKSVKYTPAKFI